MSKNLPSLYEIDKVQAQIEDILSNTDNDDDALIEDCLNAIKADKQVKLIAYSNVIQRKEALIKGGKEYIDIIKNTQKVYEKDIEKMKRNIANSMEKNGVDRYDTPVASFTNRESTVTDTFDESLIPDEYFNETVKVTRTPDKKRIKKAIEDGVNIQGARLIKKNNLQIKKLNNN